MSKANLAGYLIVIIAAFGIAGMIDYQDESDQQQEYCDMVKVYNNSKGEFGWPNYKGASC
jgi:hypothetical protein